MILSLVWVLLAAAVSLLTMIRKAGAKSDCGQLQVRQSGKALTAGVIFSLALLGGFLYLTWQYGMELVK